LLSSDLSGEVNPRKIAGGLEPEKTNLLLQEFARAAASGVNASDVVRRINAKGKGKPVSRM
jgi:hypothetical protein